MVITPAANLVLGTATVDGRERILILERRIRLKFDAKTLHIEPSKWSSTLMAPVVEGQR